MSLWAGGYVGPHVGPLFKCSDSRAQGLAFSRAPHQRRTDERVADRPGSHRVFGHIACVFAFWGARATLLHCWGIRCALCTRVPARRARGLAMVLRSPEREGWMPAVQLQRSHSDRNTHTSKRADRTWSTLALRGSHVCRLCAGHTSARPCVCVSPS